MPIVRRSVSQLSTTLVPQVNAFISANAAASSSDRSSTAEEGAEALSHAIAYAISKAFQDPRIAAAFSLGVSLPTGGPVGSLIINPIIALTSEP